MYIHGITLDDKKAANAFLKKRCVDSTLQSVLKGPFERTGEFVLSAISLSRSAGENSVVSLNDLGRTSNVAQNLSRAMKKARGFFVYAGKESEIKARVMSRHFDLEGLIYVVTHDNSYVFKDDVFLGSYIIPASLLNDERFTRNAHLLWKVVLSVMQVPMEKVYSIYFGLYPRVKDALTTNANAKLAVEEDNPQSKLASAPESMIEQSIDVGLPVEIQEVEKLIMGRTSDGRLGVVPIKIPSSHGRELVRARTFTAYTDAVDTTNVLVHRVVDHSDSSVYYRVWSRTRVTHPDGKPDYAYLGTIKEDEFLSQYAPMYLVDVNDEDGVETNSAVVMGQGGY